MAGIWDKLFSDQDYRTTAPAGGYADLYQGGLLARNRDQAPLSVRGAQATQDFMPVIGDLVALGEAGDAFSRGELAAAGLLGTGALIGLVPGAGDALAKPVMAAGRRAADIARRIEVDPNTLGSMGGNIRLRPQAGGVPAGIRAYHGSPHSFDKFSMDAIGTGEGAQAYGHGLYFAEAEDVARGYRDTLAGNALDSAVFDLKNGVELDASTSSILRKNNGDVDAAIAELRGRAASSPVTTLRQQAAERADFLEANKSSISYNPKGSMYEVNINANPEDFLDWDAPFRSLPQKQQDIIERIIKETEKPATPSQIQEIDAFLRELDLPEDYAQDYDPMRGIRGGGALASIEQNLRSSKNGAEQLASQKLLEAGIPGIKYKDAGSRGVEGGTRNFVVFDENLINIVKKYGIAGAATMLGVSAVDVEQAMAQEYQPQGLLSSMMPPEEQY